MTGIPQINSVLRVVRLPDYFLVLKSTLLITFLVTFNWIIWQRVIAPTMGWPDIPFAVVAGFTSIVVFSAIIILVLRVWFRT